MGENHFRGTLLRPFHVSVGAVAVDAQGRVACQRVKQFGIYENLHLLMRETLESGESVEEAVARGLAEELGVSAEVLGYIGSVTSHFPRGEVQVEKTTLYFLCRVLRYRPETRPASDPDSRNEIVWLEIDELARLSREQAMKWGRSDFDESVPLERAAESMIRLESQGYREEDREGL